MGAMIVSFLNIDDIPYNSIKAAEDFDQD